MTSRMGDPGCVVCPDPDCPSTPCIYLDHPVSVHDIHRLGQIASVENSAWPYGSVTSRNDACGRKDLVPLQARQMPKRQAD